MSAKDLSAVVNIPWFPGSEVLVRPMTIRDERKLLAFSDDISSYAKLVYDLVTPTKNFDMSMLDRVTRDYLLAKIRVITYGENIIYSAKCPVCGRDNKNYKVSLQFPILPNTVDDLKYTLSDRSDLGVREVRLQDVTIDKMDEISGILKDFRTSNLELEPEKLNSLCQAVSLELLAYGLFRDYKVSEVRDFAESGKLSLYDIKMIMKKVETTRYGLDTKYTFICRNKECNHEWESELPILSGGFLVPCEC